MEWENKCDIYSKIISQIKVVIAEVCLADKFYLIEDSLYIYICLYIYIHTLFVVQNLEV